MGLRDLPPRVSGEWLADPAHWQRLRQLLTEAVDAHAARDPLAPGLPLETARAELGLPDRGLVEALAAWRPDDGASEMLHAGGGYLSRADLGKGEQPKDADAAFARRAAGAASRQPVPAGQWRGLQGAAQRAGDRGLGRPQVHRPALHQPGAGIDEAGDPGLARRAVRQHHRDAQLLVVGLPFGVAVQRG